MLKETAGDLLLRGKLVQSDGTAADRYLLVRDGSIAAISRRRPPLTEGALFIELAAEDWIFPGLLDLHSHTSYNLYPIWEDNSAPYANRFEWRGDPDYQRDVRDLHSWFKEGSEHRRYLIATFSELQAVAGGTTTLQESFDLEEAADLSETVLCRSTAHAADLGLSPEQQVLSLVDFFRPDDGVPAEVDWSIGAYRDLRAKDRLHATLAHLAEGRSGLGSGTPDPYSRAEFEAFMAHPAFADAAAVRSSPLTIIHACGVNVDDPEHLAFLRDRSISVIWSPVSNLLLYGETIDVEKMVAAGINVAIGSDWSPSGSKHVWGEAKFARFYLSAMGSYVSDAQLFQMVTTNAARCLGAEGLGRLREGAAADFFILRSPIESDSALEVFFKTKDRDVRAVLVGGIPRYGSEDFTRRFRRYHWQAMPRREGTSVAGKRVYLPPDLRNEAGDPVRVGNDLNALEDVLKSHDPPVKRSNMLESSDVIYRGRLKELRKTTLDYGWLVERAKHAAAKAWAARGS